MHKALPPLVLASLLAACSGASAPPKPDLGPAPSDPPTEVVDAGQTSDAEPAAAATDEAAAETDWLSVEGTSIVGFGILRLIPSGDGPTRFEIHYEDSPDGYGVSDNLQLFVLPGDAFAEREMVYGHDLLAFDFLPSDGTGGGTLTYGYDSLDVGYEPTMELTVGIEVSEEATFIVAYGPWTDPDTGRPPGDQHTLTLDVKTVSGAGEHEWVESEAGEIITSNWSHRPMLARGEPIRPEVFASKPTPQIHLEIRPLILYDSRLVRAADEPVDTTLDGAPSPTELRAEADRLEKEGESALAADRRERAADLEALADRRDRRIVMTPALAEKFRRVPIRWR